MHRKEESKSLRATIAAQRADLDNAAKSAANTNLRAISIEKEADVQRKADYETISTLKLAAGCGALSLSLAACVTTPAPAPVARDLPAKPDRLMTSPAPPALDRTCRFPWFGVAGCPRKDPSAMLPLSVAHDQEQARRLDSSGAWYEGGSHRLQRGEVMNAGEMEKLAKMAAKKAISETFLTLGMEISNPISVQGQLAFLRNLHYAARHARNVIIAGVLGALVRGGLYVFWTGFKANAAPPAVAAPR